jgi:hypothetical protein
MFAGVISQTRAGCSAGLTDEVTLHVPTYPLLPLPGGGPEVLPLQQLTRRPAAKFVHLKDLATKFVLLKDLHLRICTVQVANSIFGG